ncbi:MAG: hypothetical protein ACYTFK_02270 [Planctomycetota bacterium]|jgi:hypothetical protein
MNKAGAAIRIFIAGVAIILITRYGFKTARERAVAQNNITALQAQLNRTRTKLAEANAKNTRLETRIEEVVSLLAPKPKIETPPPTSTKVEKKQASKPTPKVRHGLVTAILYSSQNSSVVIDNEILYEGDTIHGVKVVKILEDSVEFAKNTKRWTQRINQEPPPAWNQNNKKTGVLR